MKRHEKLNVWALVFIVLALIAASILLNSGGWLWAIVLVVLTGISAAFFVWSVRVQNRTQR